MLNAVTNSWRYRKRYKLSCSHIHHLSLQQLFQSLNSSLNNELHLRTISANIGLLDQKQFLNEVFNSRDESKKEIFIGSTSYFFMKKMNLFIKGSEKDGSGSSKTILT
ncbi:hypothetical protein GQ457_05G014910 [Hibiscus cannabinus]